MTVLSNDINQKFSLSPELQELRTKVRTFIREYVIPLDNELPSEAIGLTDEKKKLLQEEAKKQNLWMFGVPKEYGGQGLSVFELTIIAEEASQHRLGAYNPALGAFGAEPNNILYDLSDSLKEKYLYPALKGEKKQFMAISEPGGGSDPARSIQTRAIKQGDKWVLNGQKTWISYTDKADFGVVFARTSEGRDGITAFIIDKDTEGFSWDFIPVIRPWYPTELYFEDCAIPLENQFGNEGDGFALLSKWLVRNRIPYSAGCIGIAKAAWELAIDYGNQNTFQGRPLIKKQSVQWELADSEMEIRAARWLVWEAAIKADQGAEDAKRAASIAKVYSTEIANKVINRCIDLIGIEALEDESLPFGRWYRELRIKRIGEGPSEIHRMVMGRDYVKKP